jgi:small subunit ribosomal protein S4
VGDNKKLKKKYATPRHPWNEAEIIEDRALRAQFGLNKKKEVLIARSFLKKYKDIAKKLIATKTPQADKEAQQVIGKLHKLGILATGSELDEILALDIKDVLSRRLQSIVFQKNLSRTIHQARQFIVHRHVCIGAREITSPSYLVSVEEESNLDFRNKSSLAAEIHPERLQDPAVLAEEAKAAKAARPKKEKASVAENEEKIVIETTDVEEIPAKIEPTEVST